MSDINKIMNKYMEPVNEGEWADIKDAWKDLSIRVREKMTRVLAASMSIDALEEKIKEFEEYTKNIKDVYTQKRKERQKIPDDMEDNYRSGMASLIMLKNELSRKRREARK